MDDRFLYAFCMDSGAFVWKKAFLWEFINFWNSLAKFCTLKGQLEDVWIVM